MKSVLHRLLVAGVVAGLAAAPAGAAPGFGDEDLKGEYLFTVLEVNLHQLPGGPLVTNHCVIAGIVVFDGAGRMTLDGAKRCSRSGNETLQATQFYVVNADGSFRISESADMSDPVHGQIVDKGRSLLLDGTTRTLPEILSWSGIGMKR